MNHDANRRAEAVQEAERRVAWSLGKGRDHLNLAGLGLRELPADFARLTGLRYLDLTNNRLSALPEAIGDFVDLRWLGLNGNRLERLPDGIANLKSLERLYLRGNRLQSLPPDFGNLAGLVELDLQGNRIANLPQSFLKLLERPEGKTPLYYNLEDNPGEVAVVGTQGPDALAAYLRQIAESSVIRLEGKLLLVGEGGVGKSTLLHALQGGAFIEGRKQTHGLKLGQLRLQTSAGDACLNCWDFSGQVEFRETHQLFFTSPAIYLLLWNARRGEHMGRLSDWLWLIKHRTQGKARVLIVATEAGNCPAELDAAEAFRRQFGGENGILLDPGFIQVECNEREPRGQLNLLGTVGFGFRAAHAERHGR